ncbi:MAG: carbohydrate kinase [Gammaproteobacteria bacterium]|nr:carbohydrate kinase [Gammaproteobacteria bacterium]
MTTHSNPIILGTGLLSLDLVIGSDPTSGVRAWAGGTCGNVLCILSSLGWTAHPVARLGRDAASVQIRNDLTRWKVGLDFVRDSDRVETPIIVQEIRKDRDGEIRHRFSWSCPKCGGWLPRFRPVTREVVARVSPYLGGASVFFMDRLSRAALQLAHEAANRGAIVMYEQSAKSDARLVNEVLRIAHVIKYADDRIESIDGVTAPHSSVLVEIRTEGFRGLSYRHRSYRHRLRRTVSEWMHLDAIPASSTIDTCGAGDWCTAGFLASIGTLGLSGLMHAGARGLRAALRYGQTLAALNCAFEGARGFMYSPSYSDQVSAPFAISAPLEGVLLPFKCPACPMADAEAAAQ